MPATVACRRDINNRAALENLRLLRREWAHNVKALVDVIDELTDAKLFIIVSGKYYIHVYIFIFGIEY